MRLVSLRSLAVILISFLSLPLFAASDRWYNSETGQATERALGLYAAIVLADQHGLESDDLKVRLQQAQTVNDVDKAHNEVLDSLIRRFSVGQVPTSVDPLWHYPEQQLDLDAVRARVLAEPALLPALEALVPQHPDYLGLVKAYADQRVLIGSEPSQLAFTAYFKPGDMHADIALVRERLDWLSYEASDEVSDLAPRLYGEQLAAQVRLFQADHGLETDAVIGPDTLRWLNYSASDRVELLAAVLERWRWLPRDFGERYLLVSIPGFEVRYFTQGKLAERHISISGRPARPTRSFQARVEQLVVNPNWTVPRRILMRDLVPKILANPQYLSTQGMQAERLIAGRWQPASNDSIDWKTLEWGDTDVRLVQAPGSSNALGQVKFHMPNSHAIYLHDTPSKELFADASRAFSSGCIRVQGVADLARTLMSGNTEKFEASLLQSETRWLRLPQSVPVFLIYNRAWLDIDGRLQLRDDIYKADRDLIASMENSESKLKNAQLAQR